MMLAARHMDVSAQMRCTGTPGQRFRRMRLRATVAACLWMMSGLTQAQEAVAPVDTLQEAAFAQGDVVVSPVEMAPAIEEVSAPRAMPAMQAPDVAADEADPAHDETSSVAAAPAPAPVAPPASGQRAVRPAPAAQQEAASQQMPAVQALRPIGRAVRAERIQIGRVGIEIPAPRGFVVLSPAELAREPRVQVATDASSPPYLGLVPADLAQHLAEGADGHRSLMVYTSRSFSTQSVSQTAFRSLRQSMRQQIADAAARGVTGNRLLDGMGGVMPGPARRSPDARIEVRPVHADSEQALMYSVLVTDAVSDAAGGVREVTHVATTALVLVRDRVLYMTAQAPGAESLDWSRTATRNWVNATLAANVGQVQPQSQPEAPEPAAKPSPVNALLQMSTGLEWLRAGQIIGVLLVVALVVQVRRLLRGR